MTRVFSLLLAVVMVLSMLVLPAAAEGYTDVKEGKWYAKAVEYVSSRGYMTGTGANTFSPNTAVTRAQFVTVLAKMAGVETDKGANPFDDVPAGKWFSGPVAWAVENEIVTGTGSGTFSPDKNITRQDMCVILANFAAAMGYDLPKGEAKAFTDADKISGYAKAAVDYVTSVGVVSGYDDGTFGPKKTATRAQLAVIIMQLDKLIQGLDIEPIPMPAQSFSEEDGGVRVNVAAPVGALPEGTALSVTRVSDVSSIESRTGGTVLGAVDISFMKDSAELEPEKAVEVELSMQGIENLENPAVVHIRDDGSLEYVSAEVVSATRGTADSLKFSAKDFSIYVIIDEEHQDDTARMTVHFQYMTLDENNAPVYHDITEVYVKNADKDPTLNPDPLIQIIYDPGIGDYEMDPSELFVGWMEKKANEELPSGELYPTIVEVRTAVREMPTITEDDDVYFVATFKKVYTVTYMENAYVSLGSNSILLPKAEPNGSHTVDRDYTPHNSNQGFEGWKPVDAASIANIVSYKLPGSNTAVTEGITVDTVFPNETVLVVKGDIKLVVHCPTGYWISFNEKPGDEYHGAKYVAPIFCKGGVIPNQAVTDSSLTGYQFEGWYDGDTKITNVSQLADSSHATNGKLTQDVNLTALWKMNDNAGYTIVLWRQSVNDDRTLNTDTENNHNSEKKYDYWKMTKIDSAPAGQPIPVPATGEYSIGITTSDDVDVYGFKYSWNDAGERNIAPDGSTVLNIYYDREVVTYKYHAYDLAAIPNSDVPSSFTSTSTVYFIDFNGQKCAVRRDDRYTSYTNIWEPTTSNSTSSTGTQYGIVDGTWTQLYYRQNSWTYYSGGYYYQYNGTRYYHQDRNISGVGYNYFSTSDRLNYAPYYTYQWIDLEDRTMIGLYGQKLEKYSYSFPADYRWFTAQNSSTFISVKDMFEESINDNPTDPFVSDFYGKKETFDTEVRHYLQKLDGEYPVEPNFTIPTIVGNGMVFRTFQGYTASAFRIKLPDGVTTYTTGTSYSGNNLVNPTSHTAINGWTDWLAPGTGVEYTGNSRHELDRWAVTEGGIDFRYSRNKANVHYLVNGVEVATSEDIMYEASLAGCDNVTPTGNPGEVFVDWYEDEAFTKPFDFANATMPLEGVSVYGKFQVPEYRIFVYPNVDPNDPRDGCWDWSYSEAYTGVKVVWNDKYQSTCFKITAGVISGGQQFMPVRSDGLELVGWYTDPTFTKPFNFATEVNDETTVPYDWNDANAPMTDYVAVETQIEGTEKTYDNPTRNPEGTGALQWNKNKDKNNNRTWITRSLSLYARWRETIPGAHGINVEYVTVDGDQHVPTDSRYYTDAADAVAMPCSAALPANAPEGTRFMYWIVQTWNGTEYVDKMVDGKQVIVYPGGNFSVELDDAKVVDWTDENDPTITKKYTVQLKAYYFNSKQEVATHVIWYGNGGTKSGTEATSLEDEYKYSKDTQINAPIEIEPDLFKHPDGKVFLGWVKLSEDTVVNFKKDAQGNYVTDENGNKIIESFNELTGIEDQVWLEFHPADTDGAKGEGAHESCYFTVNEPGNELTNGKEVTHIAADEQTPYDIMVAVWSDQAYFYIYHSATNTMEAHRVIAGETVNLKDMVTPGYLYGGYYKHYGAMDSDTEFDATYNAAYAPNKQYQPQGVATYDGVYLDANNNRLWKRADAYTANGSSLTPKGSAVYCIKEVPEAYLTSRVVWTVDLVGNEVDGAKPLKHIFLLTVTDDNLYKTDGTGFTVSTGETTKFKKLDGLAKTFTLTQAGNPAYTGSNDPVSLTIDASHFSVKNGYIVVRQADEMISGDTFGMIPTWTTLDGVEVRNNPISFSKTTTTSPKYTATGAADGSYTVQALSWRHFYDGKETMYLYTAGCGNSLGGDWWDNDCVVKIRFREGTGTPTDWIEMTYAEYTNSAHYMMVTVPVGNWTEVQLIRHAKPGSSWENRTAWMKIPYYGQTEYTEESVSRASISANCISKYYKWDGNADDNTHTSAWTVYPNAGVATESDEP